MTKGTVIWLTGISGAGKSTLAAYVSDTLRQQGIPCEMIDGEDVRDFFGNDISFTRTERITNLKRIVYGAKLLSGQGICVVVAAIAPYYEGRDFIRQHLNNYVQVYVKASLDTVVKRDVKGHYKKYTEGDVHNFIGMDDRYEEPRNPAVIVDTGNETVEQSLKKIIRHLQL